MYIKNQVFRDEDTLLEILFDFSLGNPAGIIKDIISSIEKDLLSNETYINYYNSLATEDDKVELHDEESRLRLAEKLMELFESFEVRDSKLYGSGAGGKALLYEIDLY